FVVGPPHLALRCPWPFRWVRVVGGSGLCLLGGVLVPVPPPVGWCGFLSCPRVLAPLAPRYVLCCLVCSTLQVIRCSWTGLLDRVCRRRKAHGARGGVAGRGCLVRCHHPGRFSAGPCWCSRVGGGSSVGGSGFPRRMSRPGRWVLPGGDHSPLSSGTHWQERPKNVHTTLSVTPNFLLGQMVVGVIDGGGQPM